ncbi:MAG: sulfotransferase family 2 domain-containing protein [Planctomycetales bacterium]|nr:sulfotransferase family 2 domain-containing protein [Planctomycetales bacterium]
MVNEATYYHLHIPKTAGTTFRSMFENEFGFNRCLSPLLTHYEMLRLPKEQFESYRLYGGHLEYGYYLPSLIGRELYTFTLLRDPSTQLISLYKQVVQEVRDPLHEYVMQNCPSIGEFLHDELICRELYNPQTVFLALAERRFTPTVIEQVQQAESLEQYYLIVAEANRTQDTLRQAPDYLLSTALSRLEECDFVGISEEVDTCLSYLRRQIYWPNTDEIPSQNVSNVPVSNKELDCIRPRIEELTALDRVLYQYAVERVKSRQGAKHECFVSSVKAA